MKTPASIPAINQNGLFLAIANKIYFRRFSERRHGRAEALEASEAIRQSKKPAHAHRREEAPANDESAA